jgi:transcriptional regulator with XRE-family HTH domain
MSTVGRRIAEIRKAKGLKQLDLGHAIGKDTQTISRWERGEADPRSSDLERIADALGVSAADFFLEQPTASEG